MRLKIRHGNVSERNYFHKYPETLKEKEAELEN
jgi:hypothetical protein